MQKNNFAVSLVFMLYDMQHLKKREENKNLVYKLEPTLIVQVVLVIILIKPDLSGSGSMLVSRLLYNICPQKYFSRSFTSLTPAAPLF